MIRSIPGHAVWAMLAMLLWAGSMSAWAEDKEPALSYGGPFELVDHDGNKVTDADYQGKHLVVMFGYTHCPDVCPNGLYTIATAIRRLGELGDQVVPVFVSVDPKRDTPERLKQYVKAFHPNMVGLTGDKQSVFNAARAYRVFYFSGEIDGRYVVDHTANYYVMGPDGQFLELLPHGTGVEAMSEALKRHL